MSESETPKWQPLNSRQRRVLGTLIEKAKTTPDAYPMTVNALVSGCNQKSNREPQMNLSQEDVEQLLSELRGMGVVAELQGGGRVPKYRHYAHDWLGTAPGELGVMAELLLRGEQTLGDLRARAARMDAIPDQGALKLIVDSLLKKKLMLELTSPGRGQIVSHNLYKERELPELKARYAGHTPPSSPAEEDGPEPARTSSAPSAATPRPASGGAATNANYVTRDMFNEVVVEVAEMRAEMARVREELRLLRAATGTDVSEEAADS